MTYNNTKKHIFVIFVIIILVAAILAVVFVLYNKNETDSTPVQSESVPYIADDTVFAGDSNLLFVCNGDSIGDSVFAMIMEFRIYSETIDVTLLDMNTVNNDKTYAESYRYGGIDSLINSVQTVRNCSINRYMIIDKTGIGKITDKLGSVTLNVAESFTYNATDKSYEVSAVNTDLGSDALYTYLTILGNYPDNEKLKDAICTILMNYISKINAENSEMIFGELCNSVTTNITIADYYTSKDDFNYLLSHNPECNISDDVAEE